MTSLVSDRPCSPSKRQTVIGTFNVDDPLVEVEFERARLRLVKMHETRRFGLRKKVCGDAVQIVLVERLR